MNAAAPDEVRMEKSGPGFWQRRLILPIRTQLTQGVSPAALSRALAAGFLLGIFPMLGTTTLLCLLAGAVFRLNQPVLQAINWLVYPLQVLFIPVFIRLGEWLTGAEPIAFSVPKMLELFSESPARFFAEFGATCLHAVGAWAAIAPPVGLTIFLVTRPLLQAAARKWASVKAGSAP